MYLDYGDMFLLVWCFITTLLWVMARDELKHLKYRIGNTLQGIAEGRLKVVDHGDHCEIEEINNAR